MGGLRKKIKVTFAVMFAATLAIAGIFPLAGFFSKDAILFGAFTVAGGHDTGGHILYGLGLLTALLTAFYMFRLVFLTFWGEPRYDEQHVHVHESPWSMLGPLVVLAVLSVVGGWVAAPALWGGKDHFTEFLAPVFGGGEGVAAGAVVDEAAAHSLELTLAVVATFAALFGIFLAYWLYVRQPKKPADLAKSMQPAYKTLLNKYWVDELYAATVVRPLVWLSENVFWKIVDVDAIDGTVNGIAHGAAAVGDTVRQTQSGNTRSYAVWVVVGAIAMILILFWPALRPTLGMVSK